MAGNALRGDVDTKLLWTFAFCLPAFDVALICFPFLAVNLLANFFLHHSAAGHYYAPVIAILFFAVVVGIGRLKQRPIAQNALAGGFFAVCLGAFCLVDGTLVTPRGGESDLFASRPLNEAQIELLRELESALESEDSLAVSRNLAFRFAHRKNLNYPIYDPDRLADGTYDYILFDSSIPILIPPDRGDRLQAIFKNDYRLIREIDGLYLFASRNRVR